METPKPPPSDYSEFAEDNITENQCNDCYNILKKKGIDCPNESCDYFAAKKKSKQILRSAHPDKGGDPKEFQKIRPGLDAVLDQKCTQTWNITGETPRPTAAPAPRPTAAPTPAPTPPPSRVTVDRDRSQLLFENKVKSIAEFPVIYVINKYRAEWERDIGLDVKIVSRGGDGLNYYFDELEFTPTHDFDLGIVTLGITDQLNQQQFNIRVNAVTHLGTLFANNLTLFFRENVMAPEYRNLTFNFNWMSERLAIVQFTYKIGQVTIVNSVIDIYIYDQVAEGVMNNSLQPSRLVQNERYWARKILQTDIPNNEANILRDLLPNFVNGLKSTLVLNKIDTVVQDITTNMNYIAPGDLFNDTLRMIYQSLYRINVDDNNNKLVKYTKKLSKLIDIFNRVGICPESSCRYDVSANILFRTTNIKDCVGNLITSPEQFKEDFLSRFHQTLDVSAFMNIMSVKKLCEINYVLTM